MKVDDGFVVVLVQRRRLQKPCVPTMQFTLAKKIRVENIDVG